MHIVRVGRLWLILEPEEFFIIVTGHGQAAVGERDGGDAGDAAELLVEAAEVGAGSDGIVDGGGIGRGNAEAQDAVGVETGVGVGEREEAAEGEAGSSEKDDSGGHFEDDEPVLGAMTRAVDGAAAFAQDGLGRLCGDLPGGNEPEQNAGSERDEERKGQHGRAEVDVGGAGQRLRNET